MLIVHITAASPLKLSGADYEVGVTQSGALEIRLNKRLIAHFPSGSWKYFTNVEDDSIQFTEPNTTTGNRFSDPKYNITINPNQAPKPHTN